MPRAVVDRWASKWHLTAEASLVLILRRFGGRSDKPVRAAGGGVHLKEPEYRGLWILGGRDRQVDTTTLMTVRQTLRVAMRALHLVIKNLYPGGRCFIWFF